MVQKQCGKTYTSRPYLTAVGKFESWPNRILFVTYQAVPHSQPICTISVPKVVNRCM